MEIFCIVIVGVVCKYLLKFTYYTHKINEKHLCENYMFMQLFKKYRDESQRKYQLPNTAVLPDTVIMIEHKIYLYGSEQSKKTNKIICYYLMSIMKLYFTYKTKF